MSFGLHMTDFRVEVSGKGNGPDGFALLSERRHQFVPLPTIGLYGTHKFAERGWAIATSTTSSSPRRRICTAGSTTGSRGRRSLSTPRSEPRRGWVAHDRDAAIAGGGVMPMDT